MSLAKSYPLDHICSHPECRDLIVRSVNLALAGARRDVELQCAEVQSDAQGIWWDTSTGLFMGDDHNDREFREQLQESVSYLGEFDQFDRHPEHSHWIRFKGAAA